jgi:hypothetical protein
VSVEGGIVAAGFLQERLLLLGRPLRRGGEELHDAVPALDGERGVGGGGHGAGEALDAWRLWTLGGCGRLEAVDAGRMWM